MKVSHIFAAAALCAFPALASAHSLYLSGTIGNAPVLFVLDRSETNSLDGFYYYLRHGEGIELSGTIDPAGNFTLDENAQGKKALLRGAAHNGHWTGTWTRNAGGAPLPLALTENRDKLSSISGAFACDARQHRTGEDYTFHQSLRLALNKGRVTKLSIFEGAAAGADEQQCNIGLSDVKPEATRTGVLLRAKADDPSDTGEDAMHCTVRIIASGDYLYVEPGDAGEAHNDCKGAGDTMFCSARGNWTGLFLDRKTGKCVAEQ